MIHSQSVSLCWLCAYINVSVSTYTHTQVMRSNLMVYTPVDLRMYVSCTHVHTYICVWVCLCACKPAHVLSYLTHAYNICIILYSRTWIVSTLKGRQNRYSLSEVLIIQGVLHEVGTEKGVLTIQEYLLTQVLEVGR